MEMERLYQERLTRYVTTMRGGVPDRVPIRPFVAELTAKVAGFTVQQVTHDYNLAFEAACQTAKTFDWDAVVANMVYVWTGLTMGIGLKYYGVPGVDVPPHTGFQYREPAEEDAFMKADEYDALIDDPTAFLYNVWLPRACPDVSAPGTPNSYRNNLSFVRGGMALMQYFTAFGPQVERMRTECGTPSAIAGILKAPFDILADKMRGYTGLTMDMMTQPDKVLRACEALQPHLLNVALGSGDPSGTMPVGFWMHRGCVPFVSRGQFESHYWPTLRPIIEGLWSRGRQTLFYAEGDWKAHLSSFATLPERSIVYHVDRGDIHEVRRALGDRFCLSGGIPNVLLSYGKPEEVREVCRQVIEGVGRNGGYIADAGAIMQDDTSIENLKAMTEAVHEFGVYSQGSSPVPPPAPVTDRPLPTSNTRHQPGECLSWDEKRSELAGISGDEGLVKSVWQQVDGLANMYIWQLLLSF